MTNHPSGQAWRATTHAIADPGPLVDALPDAAAVAWLRHGDGMVGIGEAARRTASDPAQADAWWRGFAARIDHESELPDVWGAGPVAFGSFAFDPAHSATPSVLVVPRFVVGRRGDVAWLTTLTRAGEPDAVRPTEIVPVRPPRRILLPADPEAERSWTARVAEVVARIGADATLGKVVLARAVEATASDPLDPRWLVRELASAYPSTWTFHVAGLVGASPELLIRRQGGLATSRVLAGTIRRGTEGDSSLEVALERSAKDQAEHAYAVASVAQALAPFCSGMNVPESPYVLRLPNVLHLASDVTGVPDARVSVLGLAAALHPSAAVCGTPTESARATIRGVEGLDRGRYAGPVGWIDTAGDGEFAIALRCGQLAADARTITLYAGCGIVAQSDPAAELAETRAKLIPMLDALRG